MKPEKLRKVRDYDYGQGLKRGAFPSKLRGDVQSK